MKSFHHVTIIIRKNRTSRSIISDTPPMEQDPSCQISYLWDKTHHIKYSRRNKTHHIKYPSMGQDYPSQWTRSIMSYTPPTRQDIMSNTLPTGQDPSYQIRYQGTRPIMSNTLPMGKDPPYQIPRGQDPQCETPLPCDKPHHVKYLTHETRPTM